MNRVACLFSAATVLFLSAAVSTSPAPSSGGQDPAKENGRKLFEEETFGGNGRTCRTCHSIDTGTVSPRDAQERFKNNPLDPLFVHDGTDDGNGHGVTRMLRDATILLTIQMKSNVKLADDPAATSVVVARGIPTTLNTPALDPVLMLDGRQPDLVSQAMGALHDHAQATTFPTGAELERIKEFELTERFFSDPTLKEFAKHSGKVPDLPQGRTVSEKRGRRFFEDIPDFVDAKHGLCAACHSGPMLNETNQFFEIVFGVPQHTRFQNILVAELNVAGNPLREYVFNQGTPAERHVFSPDLGVSTISGVTDLEDITFSNFNAFKIPQLRGIRDTAPYFHDNSAKTLEDVLAHYKTFFELVTGGNLILTPQDQQDIVAFMKLLD